MADFFADDGPETVSTPEGDGDFNSSEPLTPDAVESSVEGMQRPRGGAPAAYETDTPSEIVSAIDKVSRGKIVP
jgi:hypothetical protein